jgi:soluble lytic murein transglycosylase-like protein
VDRRVVWAAALAVLLVAFPPTRRIVARVGGAVERAVAASRGEAARERTIARYMDRYGIGYEMAAAIERAARQEGVKTDLAFRLVRVESEFRERAVSPVGAVGLTQLMPQTAKELKPGITRAEMFERETNLRLGFRYFRRLLRHYHGDVDEALHAYNRGIGTVAKIREAGGDPANGYADQVLGAKGASPVGPPRAAPASSSAAPSHESAPARLPSM